MATPHTIAVAGKGGVGKTTISGMIIDYLTSTGKGPVLVVDVTPTPTSTRAWGWRRRPRWAPSGRKWPRPS